MNNLEKIYQHLWHCELNILGFELDSDNNGQPYLEKEKQRLYIDIGWDDIDSYDNYSMIPVLFIMDNVVLEKAEFKLTNDVDADSFNILKLISNSVINILSKFN